jgi:ATP-dependent Clp protease protease subunit
MEWKYTVDPLADTPIMLLNKDIGVDPKTGDGIDGSLFQAELMALDAMKPKSIEVWINCVGGNVDDGYNIYSGILLSKTPVDTICLGMAASIAGVIFQAGRKRIMMDYSWLMYHNPHGSSDKKLLDIMKGSISKMIARSGKPEDDILNMMKKETFIYANEAKDFGLCDEVRKSTDHNKKRLALVGEPGEVSNFHKEANSILNKLLEKPNNKIMIKVANKLGLNPDASEDSMLSAIADIQNKAKSDLDAAEDKVKNKQKELDDATEEMDKLKKEKNAMKEANDKIGKEKAELETAKNALQKEKDDAEDAMVTEKAKNMVEGFAKTGRIKNEAKVISFYTELAAANKGAGFDVIKDQLEALPLNKIAPVINLEKDSKPTYTFAGVMGSIANKLETKNNK